MSSGRAADLVVIGGGIVGWSAAYTASLAGASVVVVDRRDAGQATAAGAGIISPGTSHAPAGPMQDLAQAAVAFYPQLLDLLAADGQTETGFGTPGVLYLFQDEAELSQRAAKRVFAEGRKAAGVGSIGEIREIDSATAQAMFPPLAPIAGALHLSGASRIDGRKMRDSLQAATVARGGALIEGSATVQRDGDRITTVLVGDTAIAPGAVIVAGGAWTPEIAGVLGCDLAIYPQRGQILHLDLPDQETGSWPILHGLSNHYVLTFPHHRVVAGATREDDAGWVYAQTAAGVHSQLHEVLRVAPGLAKAQVHEVRVGFRPASRDGMPFLGQLPGIRNGYVASGHGPSGLQNGPVSGAAVARIALGGEAGIGLAAFAPGRTVDLTQSS